MAMTLPPRFFVPQSLGKYLSVTENVSSNIPSGFLKFDENQILNPRVKFAAEPAETGDGKLVHIRSCYNNKYWSVDLISDDRMIVASGKKPEEDQTKDSCTLFELVPVQGDIKGAMNLRFVSKGMSANRLMSHDTEALRDGVTLGEGYNLGITFTVIDWETLMILPTQVSFRSEELDGNYLCSHSVHESWAYQRFESGVDVGDPRVAMELFPTPDGNYLIKDVYFGKFWSWCPNMEIWAIAENDASDKTNLFSILKISESVIGLRSLGNNRFCGEGNYNYLTAAYPTLSRQARLIMEERVLNREISDIRYRLTDSRIYQEKIQEVSHAFATNDNPNDPSTITLNYSISDSWTTHWTNSVSIKLGVSLKLTYSTVPLIWGGEIALSAEFGFSHEWGVSETTERTRGVSYAVVVPPLTTMKVSLMATKGACDVPFNYTQRDLLTTGERVITTKDDGIFTGMNSYNFYFQSTEVPKKKTTKDHDRISTATGINGLNFNFKSADIILKYLCSVIMNGVSYIIDRF